MLIYFKRKYYLRIVKMNYKLNIITINRFKNLRSDQ